MAPCKNQESVLVPSYKLAAKLSVCTTTVGQGLSGIADSMIVVLRCGSLCVAFVDR